VSAWPGQPRAIEAPKLTELTLREGIAGTVAAYCPVLSAATRHRGRLVGGEAGLL